MLKQHIHDLSSLIDEMDLGQGHAANALCRRVMREIAEGNIHADDVQECARITIENVTRWLS